MATAKVRQGGAWVGSGLEGSARIGGVSVPYGPGGAPATPQSLFTSQTPVNPDFTENVAANTLGTVIQAKSAGSITKGRWRFPNTTWAGAQVKFVLYNNANGARLSEATFVSPTFGAWNEVALPSPVAATLNQVFVAAVYITGTTQIHYPFAGSFFTAGLVNGDLYGMGGDDPRGFGNGRFGSSDAYPTGSFNSTCYFVDLVFVAS